MSTESGSFPVVHAPIESPLSLRDVAILLVKHYGLHEGRYDLSVEIQIGIGAIGPDLANLSPGATVAITRIGLAPTQSLGSASVDAGEVNPALKGKKKASSKTSGSKSAL